MPPARLILDGGLATELEARGLDLGDALWSARLLRDDPDAIRAVHRSFVEAGADCVITASYQATLATLDADLLRLSIALAREAQPRFVAASVGPYGAARADGSEYTGAYDLDENGLRDWHAERFRLLDGGAADFLACETLPSFAEARALARLLARTPAWFSFTCRDEHHVSDGTPLAECVRFLEPYDQVVAVGVNCTPPRLVEPLLRGLATAKTLVAYPNSGETWDAARRRWTGTREPEAFARLARRWWDAGARWIGGCCRTGPEHIRRLAAALPAPPA